MRRANVYFKPQRSGNGRGERMTQSTGLYLARSLRTLAGPDMANVARAHIHTRTTMTLWSAELFEELALLKACLHLQYIGPVY